MISLFDLFKIGIGPSSSHTMGPMVAANLFIKFITQNLPLTKVQRIQVDLYGSLATTGRGHATDTACILGLLGFKANLIDSNKIPQYLKPVLEQKKMNLNNTHLIDFDIVKDIVWHIQTSLPEHPNGLTFTAFTTNGSQLERTYYSVGGGFVVEGNTDDVAIKPIDKHANRLATQSLKLEIDDISNLASKQAVPYPFSNAEQLLNLCNQHHLTISQVMMHNELALRDKTAINNYLDQIWDVMQQCVINGCKSDGTLPGGLNIKRRAKTLHQQLLNEANNKNTHTTHNDTLLAMDWIDLYALAVNEENANGGRVVTAPTNGAAGIIPAVLHYYRDFNSSYSIQGVREFLLTASAIGIIIKTNASISGAEVGCQGEVGSACAMAAAGLAHVLNLTPSQCTNAAEIGIEHNLGLTCDPIGGLVQVPCIERNAMAAVKAINAARLAKRGDGTHLVSLDNAIATMKATGEDMMDKYKETAMGGLAIQVLNNELTLGEETTFDSLHPERIHTVNVGVGYPQC